VTWTLAVLPIGLFLLGFPIYVVLLAGAATTLFLFMSVPPIALHQMMFGGVGSYALLAVPFFIFAGDLMVRGGLAERLTSWVLALVGQTRGSLGATVVGTSTLLGAISGSSPATVATTGQLLYRDMLAAGYGERFSLGLITSTGSIAIVVPPSIAMILYGAAAEQSIPKLFIAGVIPGMLLAVASAAYVFWRARRRDLREGERFSWPRLAATTRRAALALVLPVLVLGGIYLGLFSPTEAGGIACLYAMVVSVLVFRSLSWRGLIESAAQSAMLTAQVLIIVASASVFSWILTVQGVPQALLQGIAALDLSAVQFLIVINLFLLLIGCVLDPTSAILVLTPMLMPIIQHLGIDPVHFGVVMTVNLSIGMFTPPFGLNIFVAQSVISPDLAAIYHGVVPFFIVQVLALAAITFIPQLSLWLTGAM
jgi:C4-dicarboxylate transporter DctM subunit